ncbi:MAG: hypothetical protein F6J86_28315 [Symploca sp. SIO1B1]|nr:hypothetical protein [Symploca sp. SIO1B1]
MDSSNSFHAEAQIAWSVLRDWLNQDEEGQTILANFQSNPYSNATALAKCLETRSVKVPSQLATYFSGGQVDKLVNIAQAGVVLLKPSPSSNSLISDSQLPGKPYRKLVGRDRLISDIIAALRDLQGKWIVALDGMGGIGKTALAREVAELCIEENLFDLVVWEEAPKKEFTAGELKATTTVLTFEGVLDAIGRQLGNLDVPKLNRTEKERRVKALLHKRRVLIVLDNLETAGEPQNEIASQLQQFLNPSKALLTSRHRFQGDLYRINLKGLEEYGALRLIRQEAEDKGINRVGIAEDDELEPIARITGGSPLALKLVIGQLGYLDLDIVLNRLSQVHLPEEGADEDDYVRFYKFIFFPSWRLLSSDGKKLLVSMSRFAPGVGGTVEAVKATSRLVEDVLIGKIDELWRLSFLEIGKSRSLREQLRYYLHALTKYFVLSDIVRVLR